MKKIEKAHILDVLKSGGIATIASIFLITLFAIIIKTTGLSDAVITPVNIIIKIVSVVIGCMLGYKTFNMGAVKGLMTGALYLALSHLCFYALSGFKLINISLIETFSLLLVGAVSGIIAVNWKK